jgi:hypothetical protein
MSARADGLNTIASSDIGLIFGAFPAHPNAS